MIIRRLVNVLCKLYGIIFVKFRGHSVILCYHNVSEVQANPGSGWISPKRAIPVEVFKAQMQWLKSNCHVVSVNELMNAEEISRAGVRVAITFDDGYENNRTAAIPVINELDLPMTWFVCSGFVRDRDELPWWDMIDYIVENYHGVVELKQPEVIGRYDLECDDDRAWFNGKLRSIIKSLSPVRRDAVVEEIREQSKVYGLVFPRNAFVNFYDLHESNLGRVSLGGHTVTHPNVAKCNASELDDEIYTNKTDLIEISGESPLWFAYPFGGRDAFNAESAEKVKEHGYFGALTLVPGLVKRNTDRYFVPRIPISPAMSASDFVARVSGAPVYVFVENVRWFISRIRNKLHGLGRVVHK